jgi:hypothetical protein
MTGRYSHANAAGVPSDVSLSITLNNVAGAGGLAGAAAQGFLTGLTLGLIGSRVTNDYVCTARLTQKGEAPVSHEYKYALVSTSGLITVGVSGAKSFKRLDNAFGELVDQCVLKSLEDLGQTPNAPSRAGIPVSEVW